MKSPLKSPNVDIKGKEPVNDFFPFQNVSVYPSSPSSPIKSPEKANLALAQSQDYFSRSPGRYNAETSGYHGNVNYKSPEKVNFAVAQSQDYFSRSPSRYNADTSGNHGNTNNHNGRYAGMESQQDGYRRSPLNRTPERNRFAANFNNLPSNTFEPSYLNNQAEYRVENSSYPSPSRSPRDSNYRSPEKNTNENVLQPNRARPRLNIPSHDAMPFYPPKQQQEARGDNSYERSAKLRPPGFYTQPPVAADGNVNNVYQFQASPNKAYNNPTNDRNNYQYYDNGRTNHSNGQYQKDYGKKAGSYNSPERSDFSVKRNLNSSYNNYQSPSKQGPADGSGKYYSYESHKQSPDTPESAGIAGFNFSDLEHTHMISKDVLTERKQQEMLQALHEEQEDIAREIEEQSALYQISRYGRSCVFLSYQILYYF